MDQHERRSFNEALNRTKSLEWEGRIARRIHQRLEAMTWADRWAYLRKIEGET